MAPRSPILNVMAAAALKAAKGLVRDFGEVEQLQVSLKGPADFVSTADHAAERILRRELERARPGYGFLMEESAATVGDGRHRWIVDPLDGTLNFLHGIPHFAISIALERDGEIVAGLIYDPIRHETFAAEKGQAATLNDRRLRVSARSKLNEAVIATGIPFKAHADHPLYLRQMGAIMAEVAGVRRFGAAALDLAWVAAGRFDGFWEISLSPWDIAAGLLIVRESGGFVSEIGGGHRMMETGSMLAANAKLHMPLGALLRTAAVERPAA
ncbi:MAG: inositol monophosphatase family protein [Alphaproteobacteria bacterium]